MTKTKRITGQGLKDKILRRSRLTAGAQIAPQNDNQQESVKNFISGKYVILSIAKNLIFGFMILVFTFATSAQEIPKEKFFNSDTLLLFLPFGDESGFNGKWHINDDVPRYLSVYCRERFQIGVVSPLRSKQFALWEGIDTNQISAYTNLAGYARHFKTRYLVTAVLEECSVTRFMLGDQLTAEYEAFAGDIRFRFTLYDGLKLQASGTNPIIYEGIAEGTVKDKALGITLFGKQTDRTNQYYSLDELSFGSELFNTTIIGEAMLKCADDFATKLERAVPSLTSKITLLPGSVRLDSVQTDSSIILRRHLVNGRIVVVDDDEVFINLGTGDGLKVGDILSVYEEGKELRDPKTNEVLGTKDEKVGDIQIIELRAEHLSLATIISGEKMIVPKLRVRKVLIR